MAKIIENEVIQGVIRYLQTRPYQEVAAVMPVLLNLPEYVPQSVILDSASILPSEPLQE